MLIQAGIPFRRVIHPKGLPMHNKFVLAEKDGRRWVIHEIGAISTNDQLFDAFAKRWEALAVRRD
jgi:hypothetical protein